MIQWLVNIASFMQEVVAPKVSTKLVVRLKETYDDIRVSLGKCLDALDARSLGSQSKSCQANGVQEGRGLVNQDTVDRLNDRSTENGLVNEPKLGHEVVDPFS